MCGWFMGLVIFFFFYLLCGMVVGDVKFMVVVGVWFGVFMVFEIVMVMFVIGGIWVLVFIF